MFLFFFILFKVIHHLLTTLENKYQVFITTRQTYTSLVTNLIVEYGTIQEIVDGFQISLKSMTNQLTRTLQSMDSNNPLKKMLHEMQKHVSLVNTGLMAFENQIDSAQSWLNSAVYKLLNKANEFMDKLGGYYRKGKLEYIPGLLFLENF